MELQFVLMVVSLMPFKGKDNKGRFIKGHPFGKRFQKGYKHSKEWIDLLRIKMKGNTYGFKKGQVSLRKGVKLSKLQRNKMSKSLKGKKAWNKNLKGIYSEEQITNLRNKAIKQHINNKF